MKGGVSYIPPTVRHHQQPFIGVVHLLVLWTKVERIRNQLEIAVYITIIYPNCTLDSNYDGLQTRKIIKKQFTNQSSVPPLGDGGVCVREGGGHIE